MACLAFVVSDPATLGFATFPVAPLSACVLTLHIKDSRNDGRNRLCMRRDVRKYGVVAFLLLKWRDFVFLEDYYDRKCELAN